MLQHGRHAFVALAFGLSAAFAAADPLPPEIAALRSKAENGNAIAEYNLGLAYANGNGVAADMAEAYVWLTLASEQGSTGKDLGVLLSGMSKDQIEEGRRRLSFVRTSLGIPAKATVAQAPGPVKAKEEEAPTAAPTQAPEAPAAPTPEPATISVPEPFQTKIKDLQDEVAQKTNENQQLVQQIDERSQALMQAM